MKAKCYWNLNQAKQGNYVFSVVNTADGKVDHYSGEITLKNCTLHVNTNARLKIAYGGKKSVHAWIKGYVSDPVSTDGLSVATYNPKRDVFFTDVSTGNCLPLGVDIVVLRSENKRGVIYYE
ncbi:MAG: hypothetical protein CMM02_18180 [Rhodopirellula sp.]|nr:hypothetical protein [Rhodopirellula sp.]